MYRTYTVVIMSLHSRYSASLAPKSTFLRKPNRPRPREHRAYENRTPIAWRATTRPKRPVVGHTARRCGIPESDFGHERSHLSNRTHFAPFYSTAVGKTRQIDPIKDHFSGI